VPEARGRLDEVVTATAELREVSAPYAAPARFALTPVVLPSTTLQRLEDASDAIFDGLDALLRDVCAGDLRRLAALCRAPEHELPLLEATPDQDWTAVARPELVLAGERVAVVELNCDSPAAQFALHDLLLRAQRRLPRADATLTAAGARASAVTPPLVESLRRMGAGEGVVAINYWRREEAAGPIHWYLGCLARELVRYGLEAEVCPVEGLDLSREPVRLRGRPVSVVYRCFESPALEDGAERAVLDRLLDRVAAGATSLFSGFRGEICASKICLALLSDERYAPALPAAVVSRLEPYVPWTRVVESRRTRYDGERVDLLPWALEERARLVLKPVRGHSGLGVLIGRETAREEWERCLTQAERGGAEGAPWVLQELVEPDEEELTTTGDDGSPASARVPSTHSLFVVDRKVFGVLRRYGVSPTKTLNVNGRSGYVPAPVWWASDTSSTRT
jgi:hypothetical protein